MALASCSIPGKLQRACTGVAQGCTQIAIEDPKGTGVSDSISPTVHVLEYTGVNMAVKLLLQYSRTDVREFSRFYLVKKLP